MNNQQRKNLAILFGLIILISLIYALSIVRIDEHKACTAPLDVPVLRTI